MSDFALLIVCIFVCALAWVMPKQLAFGSAVGIIIGLTILSWGIEDGAIEIISLSLYAFIASGTAALIKLK